MKKLTILFLFICSSAITGQTISPENRIVVIGKAEIEIPADKAVFRIKLSFKDAEDVKKAFALHKEAEGKLVSFLRDLKIPNENIEYTLINVGKKYSYDDDDAPNPKKTFYVTNQTVYITLDSIKTYADFMLRLISSGFSDVGTYFISSKADDFHGQLIEKAIEMATQKAQVMANKAGRKLGKIIRVADTDEDDPNFNYHGYGMINGSIERPLKGWRGDYSGNSDISSIPQTISRDIAVKVVFELK
jgi:uncharacterized protein